jgi:hypothetical protein
MMLTHEFQAEADGSEYCKCGSHRAHHSEKREMDKGFRFEIGTQYKSSGKHSRVCTVVDQMTVTNAAGEVVKRYYKSTHEFMGQTITEHEVCDATIARNILPEFAFQVK